MMINDDKHYDDKNSGWDKIMYVAFDMKDRIFCDDLNTIQFYYCTGYDTEVE